MSDTHCTAAARLDLGGTAHARAINSAGSDRCAVRDEEGSNGAGRHQRCECDFAVAARAEVRPYAAQDDTTVGWALLAVSRERLVTPIAPLLPVWTWAVLHTHAPSTAPDRAGAPCATRRAQTGRGVTSGANATLQLQHGPRYVRTRPKTTLPSVGRSSPFVAKDW
jgi:hypothetical protein